MRHKCYRILKYNINRARRLLKKHLRLHLYNMTSVNELEWRVKRMEYCRWFRNVITGRRGNILDFTFLTTRRVIIYPVTSSAKTYACGQLLICMQLRIHNYVVSRSACGAPNYKIRQSAPYSLTTLSYRNVTAVIPWLIHWGCKQGSHFPQLLPRARCYCSQLVFPWGYCAMCSGTEYLHRALDHHGRPT
jgi:hypothetical protein